MPAGYLKRNAFVPAITQLDPKRYLPFQPQNENGVVYVFALVAEKLGFSVDKVQAAFPDCQASWGGHRVRIEFEFRSSNFERHGHDPKNCDMVVCWKHDAPGMPAGLIPLELRKIFGLAREVYIVAYRDEFWSRLPDNREPTKFWSVPSSSGPDDLLLVYRPGTTGVEGAITDVYRVHTPPRRFPAAHLDGEPDWMAEIQRIAWLGNEIPFSRLRRLKAHGGIEGRPRRTAQWSALYEEIVKRGKPSHSLKPYARL